jgi:hypothetical protein
MKQYSFNLSSVIYNKVFPEYRVKTKAHIIEILMEIIRYILLQNDPDFVVRDEDSMGKVILYIDKMSRLFFFSENKYYSIVFPFHFLEEDGTYKIVFNSTTEVNSQLISKVISIIKCDEFKAQCSLDFVEPIYDAEDDCGEDFWIFLRELFLMEDGYIRYDIDKENYDKAKDNGNPNLHPLYHYDLFYSSNATFKIGLFDEIKNDDFIDLLNINNDCKYLTKHSTE